MAGVRVFTSAYAGCSFYISCAFAEAYDPLCARRVLIRPRKISLRLATERLAALFEFCFSRAAPRYLPAAELPARPYLQMRKQPAIKTYCRPLHHLFVSF